ncbi:hypothetical protein IVB41_25225 [Bradyrhizobium sp. 44]|jgi:hypothetical protein|uniref:hypothetical protein n=1 Tax=unclassified Bradyrhizobium TaxID=2631580 RepID=UPI0004B9F65B|nr:MULTISPECIES: hypothetical protein [unclassified Bradyrhizobium]MCK1287216.1 hypothetical protein [Bradyrhizobium sp. 44]
MATFELRSIKSRPFAKFPLRRAGRKRSSMRHSLCRLGGFMLFGQPVYSSANPWQMTFGIEV